MSFLNWIAGTLGYTATLCALALAVGAGFGLSTQAGQGIKELRK